MDEENCRSKRLRLERPRLQIFLPILEWILSHSHLGSVGSSCEKQRKPDHPFKKSDMYPLSNSTPSSLTAAHQPYQVQQRHFLLRAPTSVTPLRSFCHHLLSLASHAPFLCAPGSLLPPPSITPLCLGPFRRHHPSAAHTRSLATKREPKHRRCFGGKNAL